MITQPMAKIAVDTILDFSIEVTGMDQESSSGDPGAGRCTPQPQTLFPTSTGYGVLCCPYGKRNRTSGCGIVGTALQMSWPTSTGHGGGAAPPQGEDIQHAGEQSHGSSTPNIMANEHMTWWACCPPARGSETAHRGVALWLQCRKRPGR